MRKNKDKLVQTKCKFCESSSRAWLHMAEDEALMEIANAAVVFIDAWQAAGGRPWSQSVVLALDHLRVALREFRDLETNDELFQKITTELTQFEQDLSTDDHQA